jgi:hypothetical protein
LTPSTVVQSIPVPSSGDRDLRRRVIKQCIEIKRIFDKESGSMSSESQLNKAFFSKTSTTSGISLLLKCLKVFQDLDICILVTTILYRLIDTSDGVNSSNVNFIVKKGATTALMTCLQSTNILKIDLKSAEKSYNSSSSMSSSLVMSVTLISRLDELISNIFLIFLKLSKYDPKLALIARLHQAVEVCALMTKSWLERKEMSNFTIGLQTARIFSLKNGNYTKMHRKLPL